jgi:hypothetical protein
MTSIGEAGCPAETSPSFVVGRVLRVPRFTTATVGLSVLAHLAGGGTPPSPGLVAVLAVLVGCARSALARRGLGLLGMSLGVGAVQVVVHLVLVSDRGVASAIMPVPEPMAGRWASASMLAGHVAAALALTWWLRRGEAATYRLIARWWRPAPVGRRPLIARRLVVTRAWERPQRCPASALALAANRWRGPPVSDGACCAPVVCPSPLPG